MAHSQDFKQFYKFLVLLQTIAHEIGHIVGMFHDFKMAKGKWSDRYDSRGKKCTKVGGIMDGSGDRTKWTNCSNEAFHKTYHGCLVAKQQDQIDKVGVQWLKCE